MERSVCGVRSTCGACSVGGESSSSQGCAKRTLCARSTRIHQRGEKPSSEFVVGDGRSGADFFGFAGRTDSKVRRPDAERGQRHPVGGDRCGGAAARRPAHTRGLVRQSDRALRQGSDRAPTVTDTPTVPTMVLTGFRQSSDRVPTVVLTG